MFHITGWHSAAIRDSAQTGPPAPYIIGWVRSSILAQAEQLAKAGIALTPQLTGLDPVLLGHTMLSFAEMLGRLAVNDPDTCPRERLEDYARAAMALLGS